MFMNDTLFNISLSNYSNYILCRSLASFDETKPFNIYLIIEDAVSHKHILASQNALVLDTYYEIKEYLLQNGFILERKEMTEYTLTAKGIQLKEAGSAEKFNEVMLRRLKPSVFSKLFFRNRQMANNFVW
jgi:predicted transcriptional regulator